MKWLKNRFKKPTPVEIEQSLLTRFDALVFAFQRDYRRFKIIRTTNYWSVEVYVTDYQGNKTEATTLEETVNNMTFILKELLEEREKRMA